MISMFSLAGEAYLRDRMDTLTADAKRATNVARLQSAAHGLNSAPAVRYRARQINLQNDAAQVRQVLMNNLSNRRLK